MAVIGAACVAIGSAMAYLPAGVIVGGAELLAAAYSIAYMKARREAS
jgi:hypothetical protein